MASGMGSLKISPYKGIQDLDGFCCGIAEMDYFLHRSNGFDMSVKNHFCKAFVVRENDKEVVAVFALSFDSVSFDEDNLDDLFSGALGSTPNIDTEYKENFVSKIHHPALEITYLAVKENKRRKGIGSSLIEKIADAAQRQLLAGCQFISVSAYHKDAYSAVNFYHKCQFSVLDCKSDKSESTRMFRILYMKTDDPDEETNAPE